jgi:hypothetical protein
MRKRLLVIPLTVLLALLALPGGAQANHSWGGYHWARTANPFTLTLIDDVTSTWDSSLSTASADWTASSVLNTTIAAGSTSTSARSSCSAVTGRVKVCNYTYGSTGWLGVASISVTGGVHITRGTVKLNDTYFNTSTYNTAPWRQLVTCQEVGHTFGLDHQDTNFTNPNLNTCMDYTNSPGSNQHPNQHDYDELVTIYSHLDSSGTVGAAPAGVTAVGDTPASWGTRISGSAGRGVATYRRDLGRGQQVFTLVIWA